MTISNEDAKFIEMIANLPPEKLAFVARLAKQLANRSDNILREKIDREGVVLRELLRAGSIDAADRWLRRVTIRLV